MAILWHSMASIKANSINLIPLIREIAFKIGVEHLGTREKQTVPQGSSVGWFQESFPTIWMSE